MFSKRNYLLYQRFTSPVFTHKILSKKYLAKILIEQIIEIELRGPRLPGRTSTPVTGKLHDKI